MTEKEVKELSNTNAMAMKIIEVAKAVSEKNGTPYDRALKTTFEAYHK